MLFIHGAMFDVYLRTESSRLCKKLITSSIADGPQANSVRLLWNALGTAVLAETASDTDATNQSYYGETKLHFLVRRRPMSTWFRTSGLR